MSRVIEKPEDAIPHADIYEVIKNLTVSIAVPSFCSGAFTGEIAPYFTAAETAQIAKAYGDCIAAEMMTGGNYGEAWRKKFKEWGG